MRVGYGRVYQSLYALWLAFEIIMAIRLWDVLAARDLLALSGKIAFLVTGIALAGKERWRCLAAHGAMAGVGVRLAGGWLSYSWFTVLAPASVIPALLLRRRTAQTLVPLASSILMLTTLAGRVYNPPSLPDVKSVIATMVIALAVLLVWRRDKCGLTALLYLAFLPVQLF